MMALIFGLLTAIGWLVVAKSMDRITSLIQIVHEINRSEKINQQSNNQKSDFSIEATA
jgi:predicted PurR-regulated permease PerM